MASDHEAHRLLLRPQPREQRRLDVGHRGHASADVRLVSRRSAVGAGVHAGAAVKDAHVAWVLSERCKLRSANQALTVLLGLCEASAVGEDKVGLPVGDEALDAYALSVREAAVQAQAQRPQELFQGLLALQPDGGLHGCVDKLLVLRVRAAASGVGDARNLCCEEHLLHSDRAGLLCHLGVEVAVSSRRAAVRDWRAVRLEPLRRNALAHLVTELEAGGSHAADVRLERGFARAAAVESAGGLAGAAAVEDSLAGEERPVLHELGPGLGVGAGARGRRGGGRSVLELVAALVAAHPSGGPQEARGKDGSWAVCKLRTEEGAGLS
mmetsp:Transcript_8395/g.22790  ORF Transcript_8395/g.22790 Transcript_8395/m.22790 type:complete len:325 (+) Transcript_8395:564-1538(+)